MFFTGNAVAATDGRFVVRGVGGQISAGEEFTVTVELENNPGFCAIQFYFSVDSTQVECIEIQPGPLMKNMFLATNVNDNNTAAISAAALEPARGDGELASFRFRAKRTGVPELPLTVVEWMAAEGVNIPHTILQKPSSSGGTSSPNSPSASAGTGGPKGGLIVPSKKEDAAAGASTSQYSDILSHWGKPYIEKASQLGLFQGYPDGCFRPEEAIRRGQFVTVLWRLEGSPDADMIRHPFTDIGTQSEEFQKAIAWAYGQGYVKGMSDTTFIPDGDLTRQEAITILYRYSGEVPGMETMFSEVYAEAYADSADITDWARAAAYWGIYHELLQGMGDGYLLPKSNVTRAQMAKIMVMYVEKIRNGGQAQ